MGSFSFRSSQGDVYVSADESDPPVIFTDLFLLANSTALLSQEDVSQPDD
jgi:hypothetical protein